MSVQPSDDDRIRRSRLAYFAGGVLLVLLGLASRVYALWLPWFIAAYAGDTLWGLMVFIGVAFLAPGWPSLRVAIVALAMAYAIEVSQLYHAPWIDGVRATLLGSWILGYGFLWSDLVCYAAGIALGVRLERSLGLYEEHA